MRTKIITTTLILSLTVVLMTTSTGTANAETIIYVPDHYSTIQAAVDAANPGDTIIVRDDIYAENIKVNKDHLTIKSENGVEKTIVQAANPNDHVFEVTANYVKISGFTVKGASASSRAGIHLRAIEFCDISGNIISNNQDIGIYLWNSNHIILSSNIISNNGEGIFLDRSSENIITNNTIVANIFRGITPQNSSNDNNIINNNILSNERAIEIYFSSGNLVIRNNIKYNKGGILLVSGLRTVIYLNSFIDNIPYQTEIIDSINNLWNYSEKITYVYNGKTYTNYLGNYWSDYSGSDADGDGIGDTPYSINSDKDNYPLMQPFENYVIGEAPPVPVSEFWVKVTLPTNINCLEVRENPKDPNSIKKFPCISNGGLLKLTKDSLTGWWAIKIKDDSKDMWWHIEDISGKISGWAPGISLLPLEDAFNSSFRLDRSKLFPKEKVLINGGDLVNVVEKWAQEYMKISPGVIMGIIKKESDFFDYSKNPNKDTDWFDVGYMQVSYIAAIDTYKEYVVDKYTGTETQWQTKDGLDPNQNIRYGARFLRILFNRIKDFYYEDEYNNLTKSTFSAYNAGHPISTNIGYVSDVTTYYKIYYFGFKSRNEIILNSSGELRVHDAQERITGVVNGETKEEVSNSMYNSDTKNVTIIFPDDFYKYEVVGTEEGTYGLEIASIKDSEAIGFTATDIPIAPRAIHEYTIDWGALSQGEEGVTLQIDANGDGIFEQSITSDRELTQEEYLSNIPQWLKGEVKDKLENAKTGDKVVDKNIDLIVKHISRSLDNELWIDSTHLEPKHGERVFQEEAAAALQIHSEIKIFEKEKLILEKVIEKKQKYGLDTSKEESRLAAIEIILPVFEQAINNLVKADRILAEVIFKEAKNTPVQNPSKQKIVNLVISQAEQKIDKASQEEAYKAITQYGLAWSLSQKAIEIANKK